jgi:isocitrate dehydrogenase
MTKDLAVCIHGDKVQAGQYLNTEPFLEAINQSLQHRLSLA